MHNNKVPQGTHTLTDKEIVNRAVATLTGDKAQWVLWRSEDIGKKKRKKIPYTQNNRYASVTEPGDWLPYAEVNNAHQEYESYDGIGVVLNDTILGVDIDNCLVDGCITDPEVEAFVESNATYTEISPSGNGLHMLFKLTAPMYETGKRNETYEIYSTGRYLTFTGNLYNTNAVQEINPTEAKTLLKPIGYPWNPVTKAAEQVVFGSSTNLDLEIVKQKMFGSLNGTELQVLYDGDTSQYNNDTSVADAAFVKHLAHWTDNNAEAIETLWLESGLGQRDKTQQRANYRAQTISYALSNSVGSTKATNLVISPVPGTTEMTLDTAADDVDVSKPLPFTIISGDELMAMDLQVEWMVEDLFTKNALHMLAAPPHNGKTRVAMHIAVCVANGTPVFGSFAVPGKMKVLIVNEEDGAPLVRAMMRSSIPEDCSHKNLHFAVDTGRKIDAAWAKDLLKQAKELGISFIILDSLRALHNENENESHVMQPIMDILQHITRAGITVLFTHHNRKSQAGGHADVNIDNARGSSVIGAAIHGYISVTELKQAQQFLIKPIKLKADRPRQEPFTVQVEHLKPYDNRMPYTLQYSGPYDPDKLASEHLEDRIAKVMANNPEQLFTRKYFASIGLVSRPDDKTLASSLKRLHRSEYIEMKEYKELTNTEKEKLSDEVSRGNTIVYRALEKISQKVESMSSAPGQKELSEGIDQIEF